MSFSRIKRYPSDLNDREWLLIQQVLIEYSQKKYPKKYELREIVNAIRYKFFADCVWEMLPHDFPPYKTIYGYYRTWCQEGTWDRIKFYFGKYRPLQNSQL